MTENGAYDKWPNRAFGLCNKCDRTIQVRHYPESYCPFCRRSVSVRRVARESGERLGKWSLLDKAKEAINAR